MTDLTSDNQGLTPKLRFPEFRDSGEWPKKKLNALLSEPKKRNRNLKYGPTDVLSVSGEHGCVNQIQFMGRSYAGVSVKDYHVVETGDVVYTKSPLKIAPYGIIKENKGRAGIVSTLYAVYRPTTLGHGAFIDYFFSRPYNLNSYLQPIVRKGAKNDMKVNNSDVLTGDIWVPSVREQQKIAECLSSLDTLIAAETDKLTALRDHKKGLIQQLFPTEGETTPRLRFSEFERAGEWQEKSLEDLIVTVTPPGKLQGSEYAPSGAFPIIDQGKEDVAGWTDQSDAVIYDNLPLIVFGDHTCVLKLARRPFAQGADGIKIFRPHHEISAEFLYQSLQNDPLVMEDYKRHFSLLKERRVCFPDVRTGEQERISRCLTALDDKVTAQIHKIEALKVHKSGLMQQLFVSSPNEAAA